MDETRDPVPSESAINADSAPDARQPEAAHGVPISYDGPWGYANWRAALASVPEEVTTEYALISDAHFTGHLLDESSPYQVLNMIALDDGEARAALALRATIHGKYDVVGKQLSAMAEQMANAGPSAKKSAVKSDTSRFHGGDLPDELAALLSLALGARIQAGELTREFYPGSDPRGMPVAYRNRRLRPLIRAGSRHIVPGVTGTRSLATGLLPIYPMLSPADATALLRAARSYQEAVWICEGDPGLAWLLLVSAIETAANQWYPIEGKGAELSPAELLLLFKPDMVADLEKAGGATLVEAVATEIAHLFKATDKFLRFLERFMAPPPEPRPPEALALPWSKTKMRAALSRVYELRSDALHAGLPFPPPMCEAPTPLDSVEGGKPTAEITAYKLSYQKGGFWTSEDAPMLLNTFEYIARHALQEWWRWLGAKAELASKAAAGEH